MMKRHELEAETLNLPFEERAELVTKLLLSLEAPEDEDHLQLWMTEAQRRLDDLRQGRAQEIPATEVFARIRSSLA
jgi:putative addiction module component (TIGR02574 family)